MPLDVFRLSGSFSTPQFWLPAPIMPISKPLTDIADEAAAGAEIRRYLDVRGIRTVGTLALLANTPDELQTR